MIIFEVIKKGIKFTSFDKYELLVSKLDKSLSNGVKNQKFGDDIQSKSKNY